MKIRVYKLLTDGVYKAKVVTEDWSELDIDLMEQFGEPEIDVSGTFDGTQDQALPDITFQLSGARLVRVKSDSPLIESFDIRDYADAADRATLWAATIVSRITEAVTDMRAQHDTFSGEEVYTI